MTLSREVDFMCRIQLIENPKVIDEVVNDVCKNINIVLANIIKKKHLDAHIKKVKLINIRNGN